MLCDFAKARTSRSVRAAMRFLSLQNVNKILISDGLGPNSNRSSEVLAIPRASLRLAYGLGGVVTLPGQMMAPSFTVSRPVAGSTLPTETRSTVLPSAL